MQFVFHSKPTVSVELWVCESLVGVHNNFIEQTLSVSLEISQKKTSRPLKKNL